MYTRLINKSEDYIEQHLSEPISLADLANHTHFSTFHFHKIFKKYSSETVNQFVTRFKQERAAIFISVNRSITLTEVALNYGYCDSSTFSKTFKHPFGVSPSNYRKQQELTRNR
ncbi:helix-turn-helix transcriptional regulator [Enterococcus sp. HY326]|uniref:helix-turn-helix transcriptional regulator n=1 Tax=Enterococcus sp. HY326 TaxID=2971265 RepID=UPI00223F2EB1|nr:AraC family transcriptional regulator [Enterococcus sp. HY326]